MASYAGHRENGEPGCVSARSWMRSLKATPGAYATRLAQLRALTRPGSPSTRIARASMSMNAPRQKSILFLCTGNYYRSRFAECLFNSVAAKMGLSWTAASKGLALERGLHNVGPMSNLAVQMLRRMGAHGDSCDRMPAPATPDDFDKADRIVALKEAEHRPLLLERFPAWAEKVEYWHVEDDDDALPHVEREVMELIARLTA